MVTEEEGLELLSKIETKFIQLRNRVVDHQYYVEKFDALLLAKLEYDEKFHKINEGNVEISLNGLNRMMKYINDLLLEASLSVQILVGSYTKIVESCKQKITTKESGKIDLMNDIETNEEIEGSELKPISVHSQNNDNEIVLHSMIIHKENHVELKNCYAEVTQLLEFKQRILTIMIEIQKSYEDGIIELGGQNGVLHADRKVELAVSPKFEALLQDKFFEAKEVDLMIFQAYSFI